MKNLIQEIRKIVKEEMDAGYSVVYYDRHGGHGGLGRRFDWRSALSAAERLAKDESIKGELGDSTLYIGVEPNNPNLKFAIMFVDQLYYDITKPNHFTSKSDWKEWLRVARKHIRTGKTTYGEFE